MVATATARAQFSEPFAWLREYIALDTSNPPGNEQRAASFLSDILHRAGIPTQLLVTPEGRVNLYARLESPMADGGALVLLHHMDVVPPGPGWSHDPLGAEISEGSLWGRGAIDAKSLGIAQLAAFLDLASTPDDLRRDVIFLAVADEERGGGRGTGWLLENHFGLFADVEAVINEGGANRTLPSGQRWWGIEVAQKRPLWLRARAWGRSGHGATLNLHTASHRLIRGLAGIIDRPLEFRATPEVIQYFEAVAPLEAQAFREVFLDIERVAASEHPERVLPPGIPNYLLDSVQVNVISTGDWVNVAAKEATAMIDVRLLPDTDSEAFLAELGRAAGPDVELEVVLSAPRVEPSSIDSHTFRALERTLSPSAAVVPAFIPGVTDSRYFRERGIDAYGFSPFAIQGPDMRGIHGPDEHIPVEVFERGVEVMRQVARACATE